ncbi:MAG: ParB/RepB/Spo0J family partition protein [Ruminococcaceae bacterium]|nr:ParB/RepB/Spo0J family partition protein [Oscillospiraceae bacterium]
MAETSTKSKAKKGLGRGLGAFFDDVPVAPVAPEVKLPQPATEEQSGVIRLKIRDIEPNPDQPRKTFDKEALEALASSIKEHGVIQPILVKPENGGVYIIIAGERRWRAAKLAGLKEIPCIIGEYTEKEIMEVALIENLQREDLNPIEESEGYKKLMDTFALTQEEVSQRVGKSRSAVANALRLNQLSDTVKKMVADGRISAGHARAILSLEKESDRLILAEKIEKDGLSVRQAEAAAAVIAKNRGTKKSKTVDKNLEAYFKNLADTLSHKLETKVSIKHGKKRGKIEIEYYSNEDLENILRKLK